MQISLDDVWKSLEQGNIKQFRDSVSLITNGLEDYSDKPLTERYLYLKRKFTKHQAIDVLCFDLVSLRLTGELKACLEKFEALQHLVEIKHVGSHFHFTYQYALAQMENKEFNKALELLFLCRRSCKDAWEKKVSLSAFISCLQALGKDASYHRSELALIRSTDSTQASSLPYRNNYPQDGHSSSHDSSNF